MSKSGKVPDEEATVLLSEAHMLTEIDDAPREITPEEDPFLAAILRVAKSRPHWPADFALNHGHYTTGEPRQ